VGRGGSKPRKPKSRRQAPPTAPGRRSPTTGESLSADVLASLARAIPTDPSASAPRPPASRTAASGSRRDVEARRRLDVIGFSCSPIDDLEPQALGMTYWLEDPNELASSKGIRFTGRHVDGDGPGRREFVLDVPMGPVPAGAGPVAVTARVRSVAPGEWKVQAEALSAGPAKRGRRYGSAAGPTGFEPVVRVLAPGVRLYAWPALVLLGTALALVVQFQLASARDVPASRLLAVTLVACLVGVVGAKAYYVLTHLSGPRRVSTSGMSIQGFVLAAIGTLAVGALSAGLSIGAALDVTTPGLLLGMMIGRFGCFFGGCCAGRPTGGRWGLWSSDRVMGARRIPVQLMESAAAGVLAVASAATLLVLDHPVDGSVFVIGLGAYTLVRQLLFPLRSIPRSTAHGRAVVMTSAGLITGASALAHVVA
jgi:phosphatidylglycerol:prolipoprotein diacylglycerol transferase